MSMSFSQHRDVFHVWPCSPSNGTRLELGCAKVGLSGTVCWGVAVAPGGDQSPNRTQRGEKELSCCHIQPHGPRRH